MKTFLIFLLGVAPLAVAQTATDTFEVASVKPNKSGERGIRVMMQPGGRFVATNIDVKNLLQMAYNVQDFQITGAPGWIDSERYDIEGKAAEDEKKAVDPRSMTQEQRDAEGERRRHMLQTLLADRFKLALHKDSKEVPIYELVVAKGGLKLKELAPPTEEELKMPYKPDPNHPPRGSMRMGPGEINAQGVKIASLVNVLSRMVGHKVVDQTGLKGDYDIHLKWTPDEGHDGSPDGNGPSIYTAVQEQLGLKLETRKGPVDLLVIDHIERPTEN